VNQGDGARAATDRIWQNLTQRPGMEESITGPT
jgi:hypothetical protein